MTTIAVEPHMVKSEAVTLDLIIWQRFRQPMDGLLERILDMPENAHLEHEGAELRVGTIVYIPIDTPRGGDRVQPISLWD